MHSPRSVSSRIPIRALLLVVLALAPFAVAVRALEVGATLVEANIGLSAIHAISGNGRRVVYESASDPVGANADGNNELFLWDSVLGVSQITSTTGWNSFRALDLDGSGQTLAVAADFAELWPGTPKTEVYRWVDGAGWMQLTRTTGPFTEVFIDGIGISADGETVLFTSRGDYTGANAGKELQVFLWRKTGGIEQITSATPCGSSGGNFAIDLSGDGGRVLLGSRCRINGGNADMKMDLYLWDESSGFVALTNETDEASGILGTLDADGSAAALVSFVDLVHGGYGVGEHLFRWQEVGGFEQLSTESVAHRVPSIDADGSRIAYTAANGQGTAGNPENSNEIFLWDAGAIFELTDSTHVDSYYGNEDPRLDDAGNRLVMTAARAFDAPGDLRTGYFVLAVPEPAAASQGAVVALTLAVLAASRCRSLGFGRVPHAVEGA